MEHFAWVAMHYTCGECNVPLAIDRRSYQGDKLTKMVVFCRNESCQHFHVTYELRGANLKVEAVPYVTHSVQREPGTPQGPHSGTDPRR
jgi:hypothetical protein